MRTISVEVWLYGPLARYGGASDASSYARVRPSLPEGSCVRDLLARLGMPTEERGITFINGVLSAMPGLQPDLDHLLHDGDRVAFFHLRSMWPAQYRHGAAMTSELTRAVQAEGLFHDPAMRTNRNLSETQ
ncbi:MAG: MoaD/ThiS family protein [Anaerolineae bacterium]|nr:MoaD/ThiS family protein [Anaerolineae bacterium]MDW8070378.1 MoaD/ThiS family protein [Anaerolineae bacterium]